MNRTLSLLMACGAVFQGCVSAGGPRAALDPQRLAVGAMSQPPATEEQPATPVPNKAIENERKRYDEVYSRPGERYTAEANRFLSEMLDHLDPWAQTPLVEGRAALDVAMGDGATRSCWRGRGGRLPASTSAPWGSSARRSRPRRRA